MIFVDTSFFVALLDPRDRNHTRAVEALEAGHRLAVMAGEMLYSESLARLHRTTAEDEAAAFGYLKKHEDKEYSAVDCLSFVVMERLGIHEALAFDGDFGHRFVMRPGPVSGTR
jgi:predicted nucleic acid-binding protein